MNGPNDVTLRKVFLGVQGVWEFYIVRRILEKMGDSRLTPSIRDFDEFIKEVELVNPYLRSALFAWCNLQESHDLQEIGQIFISNEWEQSFPHGLHEALARFVFDHWLIVQDTNPFKWGPTPFWFDSMWLFPLDFKEKISLWWKEFLVEGWVERLLIHEKTALCQIKVGRME